MKTLYRPGQLGDVVLLGAVTAALGQCRVATSRRWHPVAAHLRGVVELIEPREAHRRELIDLQGGFASRLRFPAVPRVRKRSIRRRWGLGRGGYRRPPVTVLYARAVGVEPAPPPWLELPRRRRELLALIPGAAWAAKRPPFDALRAAADAWDGPVVVLGGPGEEALVHGLAAELGAEEVVEDGFVLTLERLAATRVAVAGDTGLMHLAGAAGARVLALFGPTHPHDGFFVYPGAVVDRTVACRPCGLHRIPRCARGDRRCMEGLAPRVARWIRAARG